MNEQYLAHYGILGMKWGKHKAKVEFASKAIDEGKKVEGKFRENKEKRIKNYRADLTVISDDELKRMVSRMTMEKQYNSLQAEKMLAGKNHVKSMLEFAGTAMVVANSAISIMTALQKMKAEKDKVA